MATKRWVASLILADITSVPSDGSRVRFSPISCLFFSSVRAGDVMDGHGVPLDTSTFVVRFEGRAPEITFTDSTRINELVNTSFVGCKVVPSGLH